MMSKVINTLIVFAHDLPEISFSQKFKIGFKKSEEGGLESTCAMQGCKGADA